MMERIFLDIIQRDSSLTFLEEFTRDGMTRFFSFI